MDKSANKNRGAFKKNVTKTDEQKAAEKIKKKAKWKKWEKKWLPIISKWASIIAIIAATGFALYFLFWIFIGGIILIIIGLGMKQ